jgi:hypothetical protein
VPRRRGGRLPARAACLHGDRASSGPAVPSRPHRDLPHRAAAGRRTVRHDRPRRDRPGPRTGRTSRRPWPRVPATCGAAYRSRRSTNTPTHRAAGRMWTSPRSTPPSRSASPSIDAVHYVVNRLGAGWPSSARPVQSSCCGSRTRRGTGRCMTAALALCPHVAIERHRRARVGRPGGGVIPPGSHGDKLAGWSVGITRSYRILFIPEHGFAVYLPAPFKTGPRLGVRPGRPPTARTRRPVGHARRLASDSAQKPR